MEENASKNYRDLVPRIGELYGEIDSLTSRLDRTLSRRLRCRRGCKSCCVDDITVFQVEAEYIRYHHTDLLLSASPHPPGMCPFLDGEGGCRIYENRPYVCRTQGYPLRWLEEDDAAGVVEMRDICPLNDEGEAIEELDEEECWTIGPFEGRLASLQFEADGGRMTRVRLRDLFWA